MSSFLFGFALVLLVSIGARDQLLVARLARRTGPGILLAGGCASILSALAMAWAGDRIAAILPPAAALMLVAFALGAAALELAWPVKAGGPKEPTHSIFAAFIVLLARQFGDAGRFLVFALAAWTSVPWLVAAGGALGSIAALALGWTMADQLESGFPLRIIRMALAVIIAIAGTIIALSIRGIV